MHGCILRQAVVGFGSRAGQDEGTASSNRPGLSTVDAPDAWAGRRAACTRSPGHSRSCICSVPLRLAWPRWSAHPALWHARISPAPVYTLLAALVALGLASRQRNAIHQASHTSASQAHSFYKQSITRSSWGSWLAACACRYRFAHQADPMADSISPGA